MNDWMQHLEQRSLSFRLGVGFSLLLSLVLITGLLGFRSSQESLKLLERTYQQDLLGVSYIGKAESAFIRIGRELRQAQLANEPAMREESLELIHVHYNEANEFLKQVEDKVFRQQTRNSLEQARLSFENYYAHVEQVSLQLAHNTPGGDVEALKRLNSRAFREAAQNVETDFRNVVEAKESGASATLQSAQHSVTTTQHQAVVLLIFCLLTGVLIAWAIVRSIRGPLTCLQDTISGVARGELDLVVPYVRYPNEIGDIARAIELMQQGARALRDERWARQGTGELADALQLAEDQRQFGEIAISTLSPMLRCAMAAFHVVGEDGRPSCCATYGLEVDSDTISPSGGLIAQAARSGKLQVIRDLPSDYFRLETTLGGAQPKVLILAPILGRDGVLGVLELAGFGEMNDLRHTFLVQACKLLAPRLEVLKKNAATRTLLAQTQQQTQALSASEAALQARQGELEVQRRILREQLKFQQALVDAIPYPIFYKDAEGRYLGVNRAYEAAFSIDRASILGSTVIDVDYLQPALQAQFSTLTGRMLATGGQHREEFNITYADGETRETIYAISSFAGEDGKISGLIGALIDISPQKAAQRAMAAAKETAEEATRMKSDFLANMSHEIRTPMNAVLGMSRLALDTDLTAKQRNYIEKVNLAATNLLGIINDILDFSKIEAGKLGLEVTEFRLEDVLENLACLIGLRAEEKEIELLFDTPADLPTALIGDPLRLGQILINLGNNAVKFTEHGEIVISISAEPIIDGRVKMHFSVRDTGIGMSAEQCGRLFQAFSQADASTTRKYGGTGLGLAISRNLVELMQGEIQVESVTGVGSTFSFSVTLGVQAVPQARRMLQADELKGVRVLLVDDNASARDILGAMVNSFGLDVDLACDGKEALVLAHKADQDQLPYDLILTDWLMPNLDGMGLTRQLYDSRLSRMPAVIMITECNREKAGEAAQRNQVKLDGLLNKPVSPSTLLETIAAALGHVVQVNSRARTRSKNLADLRMQLAGARVLLVEDNEMNQELAIELLEQAGMKVVSVNHGRQALDLLAEDAAFDGILMDCQMPVMDGYETTRRLRADPQLNALPILAMTANAMAGDREKVLAVGMNDHIAKPLQPEQMFATMARWIKPTGPIADEAPSSQAISDETLPALPGIDTAAGLATCAENAALYRKQLLRFLQSQQDFAAQFALARQSDDAAAPTRCAHTLKGNAGNIGATALQQAAAALEEACSEGNTAAIDPLLASVLPPLSTVLTGLASLNSPSPGAVKTRPLPALATLLPLLDQLAAQLAESDAEALETSRSLCDMLAGTAHEVALRKIDKAIDQFDFETALELLSALKPGLTDAS